MQPEKQIIAAASDINPDVEQMKKLHDLMSYKIDSDCLIDLAVKEGMACLLYKNLKKASILQKLGRPQRQKLQTYYYITVRSNLKLMHAVKEILHELNQNNCRVVLLQGIALLIQTYNDIGLRPLTDVDLWILPQDRSAAVNTLTSLDYAADPIYPNTFKRGATVVDINTHILWAERIKSRSSLLTGSQEDIYRNAETIDFDGEKALCLSTQDQFLYLSLHALKHNVSRLIWLVDLKNLIKDWNTLKWEKLITRADEIGLGNCVSYGLFLLNGLFDYQPPCEAWTVLHKKRLGFFEKVILKQRKKKNAISTWGQIVLFTKGQGFLKRLSFFVEMLFPRPEVLRQVFANSPDLKFWQLYWKRGLQLIGLFK
jgi:hypothetical protein